MTRKVEKNPVILEDLNLTRDFRLFFFLHFFFSREDQQLTHWMTWTDSTECVILAEGKQRIYWISEGFFVVCTFPSRWISPLKIFSSFFITIFQIRKRSREEMYAIHVSLLHWKCKIKCASEYLILASFQIFFHLKSRIFILCGMRFVSSAWIEFSTTMQVFLICAHCAQPHTNTQGSEYWAVPKSFEQFKNWIRTVHGITFSTFSTIKFKSDQTMENSPKYYTTSVKS